MNIVKYNNLDESESLKLVLRDFFKKTSIRQRFKFICKHNLVGCEKWIQFEMYKFLKEYEYADEVMCEECFDFDLRKSKERSKQFVDITFRIKNKHYYIPLELKRKKCLAIQDVGNDLVKNSSIKPSQRIYFRKVFSLLLHPVVDIEHIEKSIDRCIFDSVLHEFSIKIGGTCQMCSVFSSVIV